MSSDEEIKELIRSLSARFVIVEKEILEEREERKAYRARREAAERKAPVIGTDTLQKIDHIYKQSTSLWIFVREKIIPSVLVAVIVWWLTSK